MLLIRSTKEKYLISFLSHCLCNSAKLSPYIVQAFSNVNVVLRDHVRENVWKLLTLGLISLDILRLKERQQGYQPHKSSNIEN